MPQRQRNPLRTWSLLAVLPLTLFLRSAAQDTAGQDIIARIGSTSPITFGELMNYTTDHRYDILYRSNKGEGVKRALDELVLIRRKVIDFFNLRLYENTALLQQIKRSINEELTIQYYRKEYLGKYVNEKSIRKTYLEMGKQVGYWQLRFPKPQAAPKRTIDSLKALAIHIKARLDRGEEFAALARQYCPDQESLRSADSIRLATWSSSMSDNASRVIFGLPAGTVRVLQDQGSLRVIKVAGVHEQPMPPLEAARGAIVRSLQQRYYDRSLQEFEAAKKALVNEKRLTWNQKGLDQLVAWANIPGFFQTLFRDTLNAAIARGRNIRVLRYPGGSVDLKEYLRLLENVLVPEASYSYQEKDIKNFILEAVRSEILARKAASLNLEKDIFNPSTTNADMRADIARLYDEQMIEARIPPATQAALQQFYNENRDSLYYQLAKVNIFAIIDTSRQAIEELRHRLSENVPFEKLRGEYFVKAFIRDRSGKIKSYFSTEKPFLGEAAFKLRLNEIAGPIEYVDPEKGTQFALIKCVERREERQLYYPDVEKTIANDFAEYSRKRIAEENRELLQKKYPVTIFRDIAKKDLSAQGIEIAW